MVGQSLLIAHTPKRNLFAPISRMTFKEVKASSNLIDLACCGETRKILVSNTEANQK